MDMEVVMYLLLAMVIPVAGIVYLAVGIKGRP